MIRYIAAFPDLPAFQIPQTHEWATTESSIETNDDAPTVKLRQPLLSVARHIQQNPVAVRLGIDPTKHISIGSA